MANKETFISVLKATNRAGVDRVVEELEKLGFFTAPASTRFHGSEPGGLLEHSLNVYQEAQLIRLAHLKAWPELGARLPEDSIVIASLLHDVCKAEIYKEVEKFRKDKNNKWETYKTYSSDYSAFPMGHGEKSVIRLLQWGLQMTDDEMLAIRWHMHAWDLSSSSEAAGCFNAASEKCPLLAVLVAADGLASRLLEAKR